MLEHRHVSAGGSSTHVPCRLMFCNCMEVGAAMAVMPSPAIPQASAATVWGQVIL
jgi:hypothetical protein